MQTAKISSKNQITLPVSILRAFHLGKGRRILIEPRREGVLIRPLKKTVAEDYYGYAKELWRELGGGEKYLRKERDSWGK